MFHISAYISTNPFHKQYYTTPPLCLHVSFINACIACVTDAPYTTVIIKHAVRRTANHTGTIQCVSFFLGCDTVRSSGNIQGVSR